MAAKRSWVRRWRQWPVRWGPKPDARTPCRRGAILRQRGAFDRLYRCSGSGAQQADDGHQNSGTDDEFKSLGTDPAAGFLLRGAFDFKVAHGDVPVSLPNTKQLSLSYTEDMDRAWHRRQAIPRPASAERKWRRVVARADRARHMGISNLSLRVGVGGIVRPAPGESGRHTRNRFEGGLSGARVSAGACSGALQCRQRSASDRARREACVAIWL